MNSHRAIRWSAPLQAPDRGSDVQTGKVRHMNYKMLLPTYRTRFRAVTDALASQQAQDRNAAGCFLNLGCGEGDFDRYLVKHFSKGFGCDINAADIEYCRTSNVDLNMQYMVADAHKLPYSNNTFDCIVCIDVIEHTQQPEVVIRESARVLKEGGTAIFTYPRLRFPLLYDPVNSLLRPTGRHFSIGAYSYGHDKLIDDRAFTAWATSAGYQIEWAKNLSGELVGALECYWPGFAQKLIKKNAGNQNGPDASKSGLRPAGDIPLLVSITDMIIDVDYHLAARLPSSVGAIVFLRKSHSA